MTEHYTIGVDFGTDSVRVLIVNTADGSVASSAVSYYPRWKKGLYCDASLAQFRQHPLDYIECLEASLKEAIEQVNPSVKHSIKGISVDTTGSTPIAVDEHGVALSLKTEFIENPNAMFILWKDHTATRESDEINTLCAQWPIDYTRYVGGIYSAEWFWAKILHILRVDEVVRNAAHSWVEHCDWVSAILTGNTKLDSMKRSRCAAGHKAMWHPSYQGLPAEDFLTALDPLLSGLRDRLYVHSYTSDTAMGIIDSEWASRLGLPEDVVIGVGAFDCHMGAVGAEIKPYDFVRVMGTSTCDMLIAPMDELGDKLIRGICGQVEGSIVPGMLGMEAGQSAFGDFYAWFEKLIESPVRAILGESAGDTMVAELIPYLAKKAADIPITIDDPVATDWINGRRTPDANHHLKASFTQFNLSVDAAKFFKTIVEATAYGSRAIIERFLHEGVPIHQVIAIGGVAKKSPYVMQTLSDVLNMPIKVASSEQACALGAAMNAACAAGIHPTIEAAQQAMGNGFDTTYIPRPEFVKIYDSLYQKYIQIGSNSHNQF